MKLTILLALITLALHAEERMRAGLWEVTRTLDGKDPSTTSTCFTPAMVLLPNSSPAAIREATEKRSAKMGCTLKEFKQDQLSLSMTTLCGAKTAVVVSKYSGDAFETVDKSTEAGVTKVISMKGRRTGDCK